MIDSFTGPYEFLSNFFPSPIYKDFLLYPTVEHAYQAQKTDNYEIRRKIAEAKTPGDAKRLGHKVILTRNWESIKVNVMDSLLRRKFQNVALALMLKNTYPSRLIERNTRGDTFWGVCNCDGLNMLGNLLMEIRNDLRYGKAL